jgi:double-stranded uracil-DNA glycosylase
VNSVLPDVLAPGLKIVFCGTAAGDASARVGAYYAGPGNRFYETLYRVGLTPSQLQPGEFRNLAQYGIGLTDLAKHTSGADKTLTAADFNAQALRQKIIAFSPRVLAFNGKRAACEFYRRRIVEYGQQPEIIGQTAVFIVPSTSGAARGFWDITHWQRLAEFVQAMG